LIVLCNLGGAHIGLGKFGEAEADLRQVLRAAEESGRLMLLSQTYTYLARACLGQGKISEALQATCYALTLADEMQHLEHKASAWHTLGNVAAHPEASERAKALEAEESGVFLDQCKAIIEQPAACFAKSIRIMTELGTEGEKARALCDWARYELSRGNRAEGERLRQQAHDIFSRLNMPLQLKHMEGG
jgi:tetratricopeptide (TPR) repeat protein